VAFIPGDAPVAEPLFFDLSEEARRGSDLIVSRGRLIHLDGGWSVAEDWGTWALGRSATVRLYLAQPAARTLLVRAWAPPPPQGLRRQTVSVTVNGDSIGSVAISRRPRNRYLEVPAAVQRRGVNRITFGFSYAAPPASIGRGRDTRQLAAGFCAIGLGAGDRRLRPPSLRDWALAALRGWVMRSDPSAELDADTGTLTVHRRGLVVVATHDLARRGERVLRVAAAGEPDPWAMISRIEATPIGGAAKHELIPVADGKLSSPSGNPPRRLEPPSALTAGPAVIEVEIDPGGRTVALQSPLFKAPTSTPLAGARTAAAADAIPRADAPDLVLITLDAARPDHFGCYGYERATTPNIDRLAAVSAVFNEAFALAPYTLCSVPTMITGLSFLDHGVVGRGHRLSPDLITLAEVLTGLGYETACFSATPNNSRALGFDQGYAVFEELWRGVDERRARDPERLSAAAIRWLAEVGDDRPIHLQLHLVPPHEPYDPGPAFDLFADPGYRGSIDGSLATLEALDRGTLRANEADLDRLVSLYDGNLRRADAAVGGVLDALRRRARWSSTLVLVTADHGEAFLEHGRTGHNSTVYDEMLRVPFILRLPPPGESRPPDTLVTLADIVPTLLAAAGAGVGQEIAGIDLGHAAGAAVPGRYLVARTDREPPTLALRSARWKLIRFGRNRMQLFDVVDDPRETNDILYARLPIAAGLDLMLARAASRQPLSDPGRPAGPVSAEDAAMLEALGYGE
jgi:arylsulfatase